MQQVPSPGDLDQGTPDLGPLAWVLEELRKSLDTANKALRRFLREADAARGSDLGSVDASQLRIARLQLHQASGALDMVGQGAAVTMLKTMEAAVQRAIQRPELFGEAAITAMEKAGFALVEFLEALLQGKPVNSIGLFPQYRAMGELAASDRVHPADLWTFAWSWIDVPEPVGDEAPLVPNAALRPQLDQLVLRIVKSADEAAAGELRAVSLALAKGSSPLQARTFWRLSAGFFEALEQRLIKGDLFAKRAASRVLQQYATLSKGDPSIADRLAYDLLFFCANANKSEAPAPALQAVRQAYRCAIRPPVDYDRARFGLFDPAILQQARKRIAGAHEAWSAVSAGDMARFKAAKDQVSLVGESLVKLHPGSAALADALNAAIGKVETSGRPPSVELGLEMATAILYLEAVFADPEAVSAQLQERTQALASRLNQVVAGGVSEPLEPWMEDLFRRVSDHQTMGSVVGELQTSLGELERSLDQYFRNPTERGVLSQVPGKLGQMRGVLSVLGLDHAERTVVAMRQIVETKLVAEHREEPQAMQPVFDLLANNLGAMGFMLDMLNHQPKLAKKLFVFHDSTGEFKPVMGRHDELVSTFGASGFSGFSDSSVSTFGATTIIGAERDAPTPPAPVAAPAVDDSDTELLDIFLEEAQEVIGNGRSAIAALFDAPSDMAQQTTLRRAFHTLKGSSRMVGLSDFGESAWALEQVLNGWLAENRPASPELLNFCTVALDAFAGWRDQIAEKTPTTWVPKVFQQAAQAFGRGEAVRLSPPVAAPLASPPVVSQEPVEPPVAPVHTPVVEPVAPATAVDAHATALPAGEPVLDFDIPDVQADTPAAPPVEPAVELFDLDFSFDQATSTAPVAAEPSPVEEAPPAKMPAFDLATETPESQIEAVPEPVTEPVADASPVPVASDLPLEGWPDGFDHDIELVEAVSVPEIPEEDPTPEPAIAADPEPPASLLTEEPPLQAPAAAPLEEPLAETVNDEPSAEFEQEEYRLIGDLRIGTPLYNVFLGEAEEWSRRLQDVIGKWSSDGHMPVPLEAVALAHSLAGSSATVGFEGLSGLSRLLEHVLEHLRSFGTGAQAHSDYLEAATEEILRLLHQFAAGFLKEPNRDLLAVLRELLVLNPPEAAPLALPAPDVVQPYEAPTIEAEPQIISFAAPEISVAENAQGLPESATPVQEPDPPVPALERVVEETVGLGLTNLVAPAEPTAVPTEAPAAPVSTAAAGVQFVFSAEEEEEIDVEDAVDPDLFPIFEEEANELFPQLSSTLRRWVEAPAGVENRQLTLRILHTLKGSARLAGAMRLGEMAHHMESAVEALPDSGLSASHLEPLLAQVDHLQHSFDRLVNPQLAEQEDIERAKRRQAAQATQVETAALAVESVAALAPVPQVQATEQPPIAGTVAQPAPLVLTSGAKGSGSLVRVRTHTLERLVGQSGEVMMTRSRLDAGLRQMRSSLDDLTGNLDRLRQQLRDVELQAEVQMQSRLAQAKDHEQSFDPLEFDRFTRVQELTRMMAESVNDVATVQRTLERSIANSENDLAAQARQTRELQRDLLRTRMVEFESVSERLYRVVRQSSKEVGKQVRLDIQGGTIEMDRGILERMTPAFEHLVRNCIAHGVEMPDDRKWRGKDPTGTITVAVRQEGNDVAISFADDGAGLNIDRIRLKAIGLGLIDSTAAIDLEEAAQLIFRPGFSTVSEVSELAGRGVGMDVVRSEVLALGGRIETSTNAQAGVKFTLFLPLTTAVTQIVLLRVGQHTFGVPAALVEFVRKVSRSEIEAAYVSRRFTSGKDSVPFFWAGQLLEQSAATQETEQKAFAVVVLRSAAQNVAIHVDDVPGNQEVVVKNLGPQLSRLPGLTGMTALTSGDVVMIYNPVALSSTYGARLGAQDRAVNPFATVPAQMPDAPGGTAEPSKPRERAAPLVLVVDDSITVRRVTQRLLVREGYRVSLAADGLQALERLQEETPDVVLSDIEMPRMDGFDLVRNIRADQRLKDLPVIMITSRIAEKHREHAKELGVNHYLGKPYSEDELLRLTAGYCGVTVEG
jgi:chemosensory pili system protein ChpA (sensor histidine kinase/response regulator)